MDPLCHAFASIAATRTRAELRPGIDVSVYGYEVVRHGDYLKGLRAPSAIYLLGFSAEQGTGLIKAHPRLLGKVLDIYLGGDGSFEESNFARSLTAIDLALYGRFVDLVARCFDEAIVEMCARSAVGLPKRTRFEQLPGMVRIAPDNSEIFVIKLNFHVADDKRGAGLDFVVPVTTLEPLKRDLIAAQQGHDTGRGVWAGHMLASVLAMNLPVTGAIPLGRMTIGRLDALKPGDVLALPVGAHGSVALSCRGRQGAIPFAQARLGRRGEARAVRLDADPDPAFLAPLRASVAERAGHAPRPGTEDEEASAGPREPA
ncbi:MAG: FliM/FliN family flagellar motor switch protein [Paracoccaceae bacterium]